MTPFLVTITEYRLVLLVTNTVPLLDSSGVMALTRVTSSFRRAKKASFEGFSGIPTEWRFEKLRNVPSVNLSIVR